MCRVNNSLRYDPLRTSMCVSLALISRYLNGTLKSKSKVRVNPLTTADFETGKFLLGVYH